MFTWYVTALVDTDLLAVALIPWLAFLLLFMRRGGLTFLTHLVHEGLKFDFMRLAHELTHEVSNFLKVSVGFTEALYCQLMSFIHVVDQKLLVLLEERSSELWGTFLTKFSCKSLINIALYVGREGYAVVVWILILLFEVFSLIYD